MRRSLSFDTLRAANIARLPTFKNKYGQLAHSSEDGSDWTPAQWLQAVVGELGEYANERKKFERNDMGKGEFKAKAAAELADVVTYLDILACQLGIDLGDAVRNKFNEISDRVESRVNISECNSVMFSDFPHNLQLGDLVRYDDGSTAIARLLSPHAGGFHARQCMGGVTFLSGRLHLASAEDRATWDNYAKYRNS